MQRFARRAAANIAAAAIIMMVGWSSPIAAQAIDNSMIADKLIACDAISNPPERLVCFDTLVQSLKAGSLGAGVEAPVAVATPRASAELPAATPTPVAAAPASPPPSAKPESDSPRKSGDLLQTVEAPSVIESEALLRENVKYRESFPFQATILSVRTDQDGRFSVTLDNGQTWRETAASKVRTPKKGRTVEVYEGSFGGYRMRIDGVPRVAWVRRTN